MEETIWIGPMPIAPPSSNTASAQNIDRVRLKLQMGRVDAHCIVTQVANIHALFRNVFHAPVFIKYQS